MLLIKRGEAAPAAVCVSMTPDCFPFLYVSLHLLPDSLRRAALLPSCSVNCLEALFCLFVSDHLCVVRLERADSGVPLKTGYYRGEERGSGKSSRRLSTARHTQNTDTQI